MPMAKLVTSWPPSQLFDQAISLVSDDSNWMIQAQSNESIVLRREKSMGMGRWIGLAAIIFLTIFTCGIALILLPTLFINYSNQQISIRAKEEGNKTKAVINYTKGARKRVMTLLDAAPRE